MKKLRKALSLLLAGAIAVTSLLCGSVTASAASSKKTLISINVSKIDKDMVRIGGYLGQDLYLLSNSKTGKTAVYRIDSTALENWRKTGKLNAKKIKVTSDINSYFWYYDSANCFRQGNYAVVSYTDKKNVDHNVALKYNKSKGTITQYHTTTNGLGSTTDGYLSDVSYNETTEKLTIKIIDPNGKTQKTIVRDLAKTYTAMWSRFSGKKDNLTIASVFWDDTDEPIATVEFIDKTGKVTKKLKNLDIGRTYATENYFAYAPWSVKTSGSLALSDVYSMDNGKTYDLTDRNIIPGDDGTPFYLYDLGEVLYGTKAIATYRTDAAEPVYSYALTDVASKGAPKAYFTYMNTRDDGKTFLVCCDGMFGYIDINGKTLCECVFDDAAEFCGKGKYAPVILKSKIILIDRDMNQISKPIKANSKSWVGTLSEDLFDYYDGQNYYLMTYK
jgi:hypothetical protein